MTDAIARLKAALEAGPTPGPWTWWTSNSYRRLTARYGSDGGVLSGCVQNDGHPDVLCSDTDQEFIAACREGVPALLARVAELERDAERYRWLREWEGQWIVVREEPENKLLAGVALDAAIDAALGAQHDQSAAENAAPVPAKRGNTGDSAADPAPATDVGLVAEITKFLLGRPRRAEEELLQRARDALAAQAKEIARLNTFHAEWSKLHQQEIDSAWQAANRHVNRLQACDERIAALEAELAEAKKDAET